MPVSLAQVQAAPQLACLARGERQRYWESVEELDLAHDHGRAPDDATRWR